MDTAQLFLLMEKIDNGEELPSGWNATNVYKALADNIDKLADESDRLKANEIITAERSKNFAATKKVSTNEIGRFKKWMVHIFNAQEGKKFPGENFIANIVKKSTIKTTREPKFADYTNKERMKFVKYKFAWKREANADVYAALKAAGLEEFCGYEFDWDMEAVKKSNPEDVCSFTEIFDSSYVQFKPKKD